MQVIPVIRGARDLLPADLARWHFAERAAARCFAAYDYGEIRTPILERAELFARQLGEHTELVEKQMYLFADGKNEMLALRPEATVPTVRAVLQSGLHRALPARLWYAGPMFRRERPQKGRYRQFWQIGAEILGAAEPAADAEQIMMTARLWRELGIGDKLRLTINNLGNGEERARHREKLRAYFHKRRDEMGEDAARAETNPLRLLESRDVKTAAVAKDAPQLAAELGDESRRHLDAVKNTISRAGIKFDEDGALVRGLDYYNLTVFEWSIGGDERRQNAVCGGGRYDGLAQQIGGGASMPGCGFALGLDRVADIIGAQPSASADCFVAFGDGGEDESKLADIVCEQCRDMGLSVRRHIGGGNLARQLKKANAIGARAVLIIGAREMAAGCITIKIMASGEQTSIAAAQAAAHVHKVLG
ncbi:MAG: histidine--tRNA ligase [Gammaproteobacteria bacterium]